LDRNIPPGLNDVDDGERFISLLLFFKSLFSSKGMAVVDEAVVGAAFAAAAGTGFAGKSMKRVRERRFFIRKDSFQRRQRRQRRRRRRRRLSQPSLSTEFERQISEKRMEHPRSAIVYQHGKKPSILLFPHSFLSFSPSFFPTLVLAQMFGRMGSRECNRIK